MQSCEYQRRERANILDAARRPSARNLGAEVIRFSRTPALGGRGLIVEIVGASGGNAEVRVFAMTGHSGRGWRLERSTRFALAPDRYRSLAAAVDAAAAHRAPPPEEDGRETRIVCMDGPGYVAERVTKGRVWSLTGSCPPNQTDPHPNEVIATLIRDMLCRRRDPAADRAYWSGRRCFTPPVTMRGE